MHKIKLNENVTKIMEINMNTDHIFKMNATVIEKYEHIKYLGFMADKKLKLNEHIYYMCKII